VYKQVSHEQTRRNIQQAGCEDEDKASFLHHRHSQRKHLVHRQCEQEHVCKDLENRVRYPPRLFSQTLPVDSLLVPEICDRLALHDSANDKDDSSYDDEGVYGVACAPELQRCDGEDAVVEADDGDFVKHEHDFVHYLRAVEPFPGRYARRGIQVVPLAPVAIYNSYT